MNGIKSQPLTTRKLARPIGVRLARLGLPPTLVEAGVPVVAVVSVVAVTVAA